MIYIDGGWFLCIVGVFFEGEFLNCDFFFGNGVEYCFYDLFCKLVFLIVVYLYDLFLVSCDFWKIEVFV